MDGYFGDVVFDLIQKNKNVIWKFYFDRISTENRCIGSYATVFLILFEV